jgi:hypothetical protein
MGVCIFAPATAMEAGEAALLSICSNNYKKLSSSASGFPMWGSILLIGSVATFYTALVCKLL